MGLDIETYEMAAESENIIDTYSFSFDFTFIVSFQVTDDQLLVFHININSLFLNFILYIFTIVKWTHS